MQRFIVWLRRLLDGAVQSFISNNDTLRAAALTYTTALSIIPR
ncbi:MAG TPA: hypothetical protein VEJ86_09660 [Candidatus Binataceae bacterium]|nr:hypothetical protein [Candidatus Binataceae bacterium]